VAVFTICLLNGISFGCVLFLLSSGLSFTLGLMGILDLSHGALYMVGAYVGWTVAAHLGYSFWLAALSAAIVSGAIGVIMESGLLRRQNRLPNEQVLLTIGLVYILTNLCLWIWGSITKPPYTAKFLTSAITVAGWLYPFSRVAIIIAGLLVAFGLWWLQDKTRIGAMVRAGMDDRDMTKGLGINLELVAGGLFFVRAFLAGFAGVIGAQLIGANVGLGLDILLLALIVVVIGGMGSIQGSPIGAMMIGLVDAFGKILFPDFAMFMLYFLMVLVLVLVIKPTGLLDRRL
jgi:branched-chain amino acid transport system permease protein